VHFVLFAALVVGRHLVTADQQAEGFSRIADLHAEIRSLGTIDLNGELRLSDVHRRVGIDDPGNLLDALDHLPADRLEFRKVRTADDELHIGGGRAAAADRRHRLHRRAQAGR